MPMASRKFEPYLERRKSSAGKEKAVRDSLRMALCPVKSGRKDLNLRPLRPERPSRAYTYTQKSRVTSEATTT